MLQHLLLNLGQRSGILPQDTIAQMQITIIMELKPRRQFLFFSELLASIVHASSSFCSSSRSSTPNSSHPPPIRHSQSLAQTSHLRLDIRKQRFQFIHIRLLLWPTNTHSFLCVWFWDLVHSSLAHVLLLHVPRIW